MVKRWIAFVVLCLLARGWALAHALEGPHLPPPVPVAACEEGAPHAVHAAHAGDAAGDDAPVSMDDSSSPDCRIVCDLGHAPALAGLGLPVAAFALPAARPMGWRPFHGVGPWPPELPPPARG